MRKEIIISSTLNEVRIAITEDGRLAELLWELPDKERHVGDIYLGKVKRIVQGMNAAFIDIGMKQDAFLHFSDVGKSLEEDEYSMDDEGEEEDALETVQAPASAPEENLPDSASIALRRKKPATKEGASLPTFNTKRSGQITINLEVGQNVIVQVTREAYANKGLRITTKIALPGRYLVLLPFNSMIGVSKKISYVKERRRLRRIVRSILPETLGCIVRTEAQDADDTALRKDLSYLYEKWQAIERKVIRNDRPALLYKDEDVIVSLIRDLFTNDVARVTIDSKKLYNEIKDYVTWAAPNLADKVEHYRDPEPMFEKLGLEKEIQHSYSRNVRLPSGGHLIFDHTEAMVVVDVNSGRYAAEREQELNSLKTNMEAVKEIARQIRLRDIGGMIIIDYIDQQEEKNRRKIVDEMWRELRKDRAKTVIFPLTQLGLLQMTRQRIRQNILQVVTQTCPTCNGSGTVNSEFIIINSIERWLQRFRAQTKEFRLTLVVHPSIAYHLVSGSVSKLAKLKIKYFVQISLIPNAQLKLDEFKFYSVRQQKDITRQYV